MIEKSVKKVLEMVIEAQIELNSDLKELITKSIEIPPTLEFGERSSNIAFKLAKILKKSPMKIADDISEAINKLQEENSIIKSSEAVKGYINIFLNYSTLFSKLHTQIQTEKEKYGSNNNGKGKKIVVEHTSINPVKPLHIGNLRNAILGDCIARLYSLNGWMVEVQNLIDDYGKQVATLIWGILNGHQLEIARESTDKYDVWLGKVYSYCNSLLEKHDQWEEVDKIMVAMRNDTKTYHFMRNIAQSCVDSNLETAWRYGITYDYLVWESDIARSGIWEETLHLLEKNNSFYWEKEGTNAGCFIAHLGNLPEFQDKKNPDKIFVRSNGIPTYVAHDVALQLWKFGVVKAKLKSRSLVKQKNESGDLKDLWSSIDYTLKNQKKKSFGKSHRVCNVIGMEQNFLQEIVRYTLKLLGLMDEYNNSYHMSYKHVSAPHARFSGRTGNWYEERAWADAVFDDTLAVAFKTISKKRPDLEDNPLKRAKIISCITSGAIRYWLTKFSTETEIKFRIEDATSLEGDTGPFLMYSFVRATKILGKLKDIKEFSEQKDTSWSLHEKQLILDLYRFPMIIVTAADSFQPLIVAKYAFDLASSFNRFYETSRVITTESDELKTFRAALVKNFTIVMRNVLNVLGIPIVDEM
ncbi:MAG: arginine--tRNA ligase [Candidatus Hodarchaeales archaeon]